MLNPLDFHTLYTHSERMKTNQSSSPATSTPKHTPGPWHIQRQGKDGNNGRFMFAIQSEDGREIVDDRIHVLGRTYFELEANAKLIAAAPELFDAADGLIEFINAYVARFEDCNGKSLATDIEPYLKAVEEAIAKSTAS